MPKPKITVKAEIEVSEKQIIQMATKTYETLKKGCQAIAKNLVIFYLAGIYHSPSQLEIPGYDVSSPVAIHAESSPLKKINAVGTSK